MRALHFIRFLIRNATGPMPSMLRRCFLVFVALLPASFRAAHAASWSCQQDNQTKEWVCAGDNTATSSVPVPVPVPVAPVVERVQPSIPPLPAVSVPVVPTPEAVIAKPAPSQVLPASVPVSPELEKCSDCSSTSHEPEPAPESLESLGPRLLAPVFDSQQEAIFQTLNAKFKTDPWQNCLSPTGTQKSWSAPVDKRTYSPLDVKSNYSEIFDNEIGNYSGRVEMSRADQSAQSNNANYDRVSQTLDLQGDVYYSEDELALHSDSATLKLASDQARLRETQFIFPAAPLRGSAAAIYRDNKFLSHYQDVKYTSCRPGNQDWALHASELKLNRETGKGSAKDAWLEFKGVPVFYSPYLAFPVDNRRMSGFLAPSFGNTQNGGFNLSVPYYWNIAPNYDATLNPKYFSKRGVLFGGDFRYLTKSSAGTASVEYMPDDELMHDSRYQTSLKHQTQFTQNISSHLDLNYVSDKNYFAELGNALSFPNFSFLKSQADVNYIAEGIALTGRVESYQTIDPTLRGAQIPYRRLPQINLALNRSFKAAMPIETQFDGESVYFQHSGLVNGQRFNFKPSVSLPYQTASGFVTPKLSVQHTEYWLNNQPQGLPTDISRTLPIMSVDSGLYLERDMHFADAALKQTLEPRLFYLYIPKTDQTDIPLFDTTIYDFWYETMFRENRFSGSDRVQDANQVTAALTSRIIDPASGREQLKFSVGEIFYFRNREVTLCGAYPSSLCPFSPIETQDTSPLVTELSSQLNEHVSFETGVQWDYHTNDIVRGKAVVHLKNKPDQLVNLGYLYRQNPLITDQSNDITQSDVSFRWPILANWYAVGRWQYSWLYNRTQDGFFGLEKENCCWRFRVIGRTYLNSINYVTGDPLLASTEVEGRTQTGVFFQIEFKGLTGIGEKLDDFFANSIYGYRKTER